MTALWQANFMNCVDSQPSFVYAGNRQGGIRAVEARRAWATIYMRVVMAASGSHAAPSLP